MIFIKFGKPSFYSPNNLSIPFSLLSFYTFIMHFVCYAVSHKFPWALLTFLHSFFSFLLLRFDHFKCSFFKIADYFFCLECVVNPSIKYFNSVILFFSSRVNFISVNILILFISHFPDFLMFFFCVFFPH